MNNHVAQSKVVNGAEIWPQQAHMPSENLLICRVVFHSCHAIKRSGGVNDRGEPTNELTNEPVEFEK